jgi:hypothetical protein
MFRIIARTLRRPRIVLAAVAAGLALTIAACGGGSSSMSANGTLQLSLTDAPGCGYDAVNVTITDVSVHQSSTAAASDAGWVHVPITAHKINLLDLQNGVLATLGQTPLPAGNYTQMRLLLATNGGMPLANSVVPTGGSEVALKTPSGQQTGLKMNVDINIAPDQMADFVVDFNACKSVVSAGASGMYLLKPVVSVTPNFISGVRGMVDASIDGDTGANTQIMLEQPGTSTQPPLVIKATTPDANGGYLLQPVAPGTYDLVVTSNGHATAVVTGVVVQSQLITTVPGAINPPMSAVGGQGGTVTTGVTPVDAALVAQQTLAAGGTIEVAFAAADTVLGTYSFTLPVGGPVVAPYAVGMLMFTADSGAAGKYTIAATAGSTTKFSSPLTVTTGPNAPADFTFP